MSGGCEPLPWWCARDQVTRPLVPGPVARGAGAAPRGCEGCGTACAGRSAGPHLPRAQEIAAVGISIIIIAPFIEGPAETRRFLSPEVPHPPTATPHLPHPPPRRGQNPSAGLALADPPRSARRGVAGSPGPVCDETGDPGAAARGAAEAGAGLGGKLQRRCRSPRRRRARQARGRPGLGVEGQPAALPGLALAPQARRALRGRSRRRRGRAGGSFPSSRAFRRHRGRSRPPAAARGPAWRGGDRGTAGAAGVGTRPARPSPTCLQQLARTKPGRPKLLRTTASSLTPRQRHRAGGGPPTAGGSQRRVCPCATAARPGRSRHRRLRPSRPPRTPFVSTSLLGGRRWRREAAHVASDTPEGSGPWGAAGPRSVPSSRGAPRGAVPTPGPHPARIPRRGGATSALPLALVPRRQQAPAALLTSAGRDPAHLRGAPAPLTPRGPRPREHSPCGSRRRAAHLALAAARRPLALHSSARARPRRGEAPARPAALANGRRPGAGPGSAPRAPPTESDSHRSARRARTRGAGRAGPRRRPRGGDSRPEGRRAGAQTATPSHPQRARARSPARSDPAPCGAPSSDRYPQARRRASRTAGGETHAVPGA